MPNACREKHAMPPIFLDARDLAERLDVGYDTVLTWVRRGKIPHVRDGRGRLMFNLDSVIETLRQNVTRDGRGKAPWRRKPAETAPGPEGGQ
jgi:excisionase family DNA binding protein